MSAAYRGSFVISWSQTEVEGQRAPDPAMIAVGAGWRWTGAAVQVDHPGSVLLLQGPEGGAALRRRAARMVRRLVGAAMAPPRGSALPNDDTMAPEQGLVLTDGRRVWDACLIPVPDSAARLLLFVGSMPPADRDLWVVRNDLPQAATTADGSAQGGVICFGAGTLIATPRGLRRIESLRPGDRIDTADSGPQPVLWVGQRQMTGARLYAMPALRPIRIRAAAMGGGRPVADLLVSPQHRMLLRGAAADALFGTPEVLVRACDMIDGQGITVDTSLRAVTYVHVLLDAHHVVFANGLESESFHPEAAALDTLDPAQRRGLQAMLPDPAAYGGYARRNLTAPEVAILRHEAA